MAIDDSSSSQDIRVTDSSKPVTLFAMARVIVVAFALLVRRGQQHNNPSEARVRHLSDLCLSRLVDKAWVGPSQLVRPLSSRADPLYPSSD